MIRVLIVEEVRAICEVIATVLRSEPDIEVTGCATNFDEAVSFLGNCEGVLVNTAMSTDASVRLIRALRKLGPRVKVVVMGLARTQHAILQCIEAGVAGYVLKDSALTDIVNCVKLVASGQHYVSPALTDLLLNRQRRTASLSQRKPELKDLSPAERRVLKLLAEYKTSREIAAELFISHRTVETHRTNICNKLEIHGNHSLMKFALAHKSELSDL